MPYVESPLDRIVNVNWGAPISLVIIFTANMTGNNDIDADTTSHMIVGVTGIPPLDRTTLEVGNPNVFDNREDQVRGPNGSYSLTYTLRGQFPKRFTLNSSAAHNVGGGPGPFSMSVTLQTTDIFSGVWDAAASSSITPTQSLSGNMGNTKTVTAVLTLNPPSLSFG
jgi:hypothetical protein